MSESQKTILMLLAGWGLGNIGYLSWRFLSAEIADWRRHIVALPQKVTVSPIDGNTVYVGINPNDVLRMLDGES